MSNIAILASGSGTNAENIIHFFENHPSIRVDSVWSNRKEAFVLERARRCSVDAHHFTREKFNSDEMIEEFRARKIDLVVLAGFLMLVPPQWIKAFPIVNIHPALLPAYGGKGMFGEHVHRAVIKNRELRSGITIHMVDEQYDHGQILWQATCELDHNDTPESLAVKIHELEFEHFPRVIEMYLMGEFQNRNQ